MIEKINLIQVRKSIENYIGKEIVVKFNKGRKKSILKKGIIEKTYPCVFVIKIENDNLIDCERRVSYSYTDVLTKSVELLPGGKILNSKQVS